MTIRVNTCLLGLTKVYHKSRKPPKDLSQPSQPSYDDYSVRLLVIIKGGSCWLLIVYKKKRVVQHRREVIGYCLSTREESVGKNKREKLIIACQQKKDVLVAACQHKSKVLAAARQRKRKV